jgi:hypothetical protein
MPQYQLYCLDRAGRIGLAEWLEASDDDDAVRQARAAKRGALKCEVWQGHRLVAAIDDQELSA